MNQGSPPSSRPGVATDAAAGAGLRQPLASAAGTASQGPINQNRQTASPGKMTLTMTAKNGGAARISLPVNKPTGLEDIIDFNRLR